MLLLNDAGLPLEEIFFSEFDKERWDADEEEFYGRSHCVLSLPQRYFDSPTSHMIGKLQHQIIIH